MKSDDGTLSFGTRIDTSDFDKGVDHITDKIVDLGTFAQEESDRISAILKDVPTLDIEVVSNASQTLASIDQAYAEIDRINEANRKAIAELEAEYARLGQLAAEASKKATAEGDKEYIAITKQQAAIRQLISERNNVLSSVQEENEKVRQLEQSLLEQADAAKKTASAHVPLRQQIRALKEEMADLVANGIDEQSDAYKKLVNELGRLTDIQGDISQQGKVLSNDEAAVAGVISGLNGLSGAMTAAEGAMSLFVGENEDLQRVMTKLQSLMAITMGLQQVQQTLNKDSAFSLSTLNSLKEWWNNLLAIGRGEQIAETAATVADTAAQTANAAATVADTAAQEASNTATAAGTAATQINTIAQNANTGAAVAGTAANIGLAGAFRMVGAAIKSIPIFGWIAAAIGVLIGVISHFVSAAKEQEEAVEEAAKIEEDARKAYAQASAELQSYQQRVSSFKGTKEQEKKLVEELNQKYGTALGTYKTLSEWQTVLTEKGGAYCDMLQREAEAQAYLNKYTEAFVNLQVVRDKAAAGVYNHWYNTRSGNERSQQNAINAAKAEMNKWLELYKGKMAEADKIKADFNLNPLQPEDSSTGSTFDAATAARTQRDAINSMRDEITKWRKDAQSSIDDAVIDNMAEGQAKEINQIALNTQRSKEQWRESLLGLAKTVKDGYRDVYMAQKGATEDGWEQSERGKMSDDDYVKDLLGDPEISKLYYAQLDDIIDKGERDVLAVRQKYYDQWVEQYGNTEQKIEALERKYMSTLSNAPAEFVPQIIKAFEQQFAALETSQFKDSINWESVFGNLSEQSLSSLQTMLQKVRTYFEQNKANMSTDDIKDYQEAMAKMEDEIASRNPFTALHKAMSDITAAKDDFKEALTEQAEAQRGLNAAVEAYNAAIAERNQALDEYGEGSDEYNDAIDKATVATVNLNEAKERSNRADNNVINSQNRVSQSYKRYASQLENAGSVIDSIGGQAQNLAAIFSDDVADSIGKAISAITSVLDAASTVVDALGDTAKTVTDSVADTADAASQGMQASADAASASISTVEKASVILAVISAALQVATAIANLFDNDDKKQKEIENLQNRIDQLQWELDNADAVRLQERYGDAVERVRNLWLEAYNEIASVNAATMQSSNRFVRTLSTMQHQNEIFAKSVEKIADAYASVSYSADKALGSKRYEDARAQLENLAEQQILIQQQIEKEEDKKKTDRDKIADWENEIRENAEKMASIINDMMEDIIGSTAEDLASELGNAFFDAAAQGEDAMEAWHDTVKDIISDITKRMMIQKLLEEPIGQIFDTYKTRWFGTDGRFKGIQNVIDSMTDLSNDLNQVGEVFNEAYQQMPETVQDMLNGNAERTGVSKGIATASQESVDENNARLTTIQGHTYSLVQGMDALNAKGNLILDRLINIDRSTSSSDERLSRMESRLRNIGSTVDDIYTKGINLKTT